jgi:hypothetical protein
MTEIHVTKYTLWCGCVLVYVHDKPTGWVDCESGDDCELSFDERADLAAVRKERE